jgi:hypothetical protein
MTTLVGMGGGGVEEDSESVDVYSWGELYSFKPLSNRQIVSLHKSATL